jgi:hypothetical protein
VDWFADGGEIQDFQDIGLPNAAADKTIRAI